MLQSISWQEFISTIALFTGGYYVIAVLLLYSREIDNFFRQKKANLTTKEVGEDQVISNESFSLIGSVKNDRVEIENVPRGAKIESENLRILGMAEPEESISGSVTNDTDATLLKSISRLTEEVQTLTSVVAHGSKEDCAELFRTLLSNYSDLVHTKHQPEITALIYNSCKEHCQFQIDLDEVKSWWPSAGIPIQLNSNHQTT